MQTQLVCIVTFSKYTAGCSLVCIMANLLKMNYLHYYAPDTIQHDTNLKEKANVSHIP